MKKLFAGISIIVFTLSFAHIASAETMSQDEQVIHIINRITYGPNAETIDHVKKIGVQNFIEEQLHPENISTPDSLSSKLSNMKTINMPLDTLVAEYGNPLQMARMDKNKDAEKDARKNSNIIVEELSQAKVERGVESNAQLQEVLTDFWFNHFNVFAEKERDRFYVSSYERDAIRPYTMGRFRDLLEATAKHPAMLVYLDNWLNTDPNSRAARGKQNGINENYAREIMELHTMGVDGGYTQTDVTTLAHILTGWGLGKGKTMEEKSVFYFDPKRHDYSDKIFLGHKIRGRGEAEIEEALDILATHPSTAHHISYQLAQNFLADQPPETLVKKMAETFTHSNGDIREVLETMFKSPEFWDKQYFRKKFKPPFRYIVSALRVTNVEADDNLIMLPALKNMGEPLYRNLTPDGFPNTNDHWVNSDALLKRIDVAKRIIKAALNTGKNVSAAELIKVLGGDFSQDTISAINGAGQNLQPVMVLSSPEFLYY